MKETYKYIQFTYIYLGKKLKLIQSWFCNTSYIRKLLCVGTVHPTHRFQQLKK